MGHPFIFLVGEEILKKLHMQELTMSYCSDMCQFKVFTLLHASVAYSLIVEMSFPFNSFVFYDLFVVARLFQKLIVTKLVELSYHADTELQRQTADSDAN